MTAPTAARKRTGRPPMTSRTALLAAARQLAAEHGFRAVTVGNVTGRCGVKYSTAYRHVRSRAELVAALVDDVLGTVPMPAHAAWREQLEATAATLARVLREWPGMADALAGLDDTPEWVAVARTRCFAAMVGGGIPEQVASDGVDTAFALATLDPARVCPRGVALVCDGVAARAGETGG